MDIKGDAYEALLEKGAEDVKSGAGQYFTPRALIDAMVRWVRPRSDDTIVDPACGTGGFLLATHEYIRKHYGEELTEDDFSNTSEPNDLASPRGGSVSPPFRIWSRYRAVNTQNSLPSGSAITSQLTSP